MLMVSEVAKSLIDFISAVGDVPCILRHYGEDDDEVLFEPLEKVSVLEITKEGSLRTENCVLFTRRNDSYEAWWIISILVSRWLIETFSTIWSIFWKNL